MSESVGNKIRFQGPIFWGPWGHAESPRCGKGFMNLGKGIGAFMFFIILNGCAFQSGPEGNPALKLFGALGICLAAVFLIFYIVVKSREKD